jgi:hypothetical protein
MSKSTSVPDLKGGYKQPSRGQLYAKVAANFDVALKTLVELAQNAKHESTRVSAANKIIDKVLPNLQASDITTDGQALKGLVIEVTNADSTKD